jgi:mono/diheme cytochrome c family protein
MSFILEYLKFNYMRKFLKVLLYIILGIAVIIGIAAIYISSRSMPTYTPEKVAVNIQYTPERVAQGEKLASMLCKSCHYSEGTQKFTGRELTEVPHFGKIYSRNITHHPDAGIGKWTDAELVYLLRTGVRPDGRYLPPYMPKLAHISDEDMYSIVAFLRSDNPWLQASDIKLPETKPSFLTKFLVTIGAMKAFDYPKEAIPQPDTADAVKHGRYIALNQMECFACHSQDFAKNDYFTPEKSPGFFGGGNKIMNKEGQEMYSLNITMDQTTGIGKWNEEQFVKAVKYGVLPDGQAALRYPMQPYANLSDAEVKAIFAYLKTVPVQNNKVERKMYQ